jgi:very-short-patch-repair endonuclease
VSASDKAYKNARRLRRELSLPEKLLWVRLRRAEVRFRRQHPMGRYVLDFCCAAAKLAIEIDGAAHDFGDRPQRDDERMNWLSSEGIEIPRSPQRTPLPTLTLWPTLFSGSAPKAQNPSTTRLRRAVPLPAQPAQGGANELRRAS